MPTPMPIPFDSAFRCLHVWAAIAYVVLSILFLFAVYRRWRKGKVAFVLALVLVLGPAIYYPISYFMLWRESGHEAEYVQLLGELWGPLWAALSGLWLALLYEPRPWEPRSER